MRLERIMEKYRVTCWAGFLSGTCWECIERTYVRVTFKTNTEKFSQTQPCYLSYAKREHAISPNVLFINTR